MDTKPQHSGARGLVRGAIFLHSAARNLARRHVRLLAGFMLGGLFIVQCVGPDTTPLTGPAPTPGVVIAQPLETSRDTDRLVELAKTDHIALLQHCLDNYHGNYTDYVCTFTKQELVEGVLAKEQETLVRFRESPFSVAMTWVTNPPRGDRVLYVEGRNNNEMQVRPTSVFLQALVPGGVSRKPDSEDARTVPHRTVDLFGFERGMKSMLKIYREAKKNGDLQEEFGGHHDLDGRRTLVLIRTLTTKREDYPAHKTVIYIDVEHLVPVMIESYGWGAGEFLGRYAYTDIQFNVGLTDAQFTPESIGLRSERPE